MPICCSRNGDHVGVADADMIAPLPQTLAGRYRPRWKDPPPGAPEGAAPSLVARDTRVDRELDLVRIRFGADRAEARDALVSALEARTTVLSPALVAVYDAGEWGDDAFVALEQLAGARSIDETLSALPSFAERLRWARGLADAAVAVDDAKLSLPASDWAEASIDAYASARVRGLERAEAASDVTRVETLHALGALLERLSSTTIGTLADRASQDALRLAARRARERQGTLRQLRDAIAPLTAAPEDERPLLPRIDSDSLRRHAVVVTLLTLAFLALIVVLATAR